MIYLAQRLDTGEIVEFQDDPYLVVDYGESLILDLDGLVECVRVFSVPEVIATDRRKRYDEDYSRVRSDGRFSSMSLPTRESCVAGGLPLAPHYNSHGEASFMDRYQAKEYSKKLSDYDPAGVIHFDA